MLRTEDGQSVVQGLDLVCKVVFLGAQAGQTNYNFRHAPGVLSTDS